MDSAIFRTIMTYRDNTDTKTIPLDGEITVEGLQALGVLPVKADTNGKKLRVHFEENEEFTQAYQKLQRSLSGVLTEPLLVDFNKFVLAKTGWNELITMMHAVRGQ